MSGWFISFLRKVTVSSLVCSSVTAAGVAFLIGMSSAAPPSSELCGEWKAWFYYLHPPSADVHGKLDNELDEEHRSFHELHTALRHYREMADGILRQLSIAHEVASRSEALLFPNHVRVCEENGSAGTKSSLFLSCKLEEKIANMARLLEQNVFVLEKLLRPFTVHVGLSPFHNSQDLDPACGSKESAIYPTTPSQSSSHSSFPAPVGTLEEHRTESNSTTRSIARYIPPCKLNQMNANECEGEEEPYDSASQILTHVTRDWTVAGAPIRKHTYDWIVDQIWSYHNMWVQEHSSPHPDPSRYKQSSLSPVLVPGAGMARLAFDIAFAHFEDHAGSKIYPFFVEATDNSIVMATAAYNLLHYCSTNGCEGRGVRTKNDRASLKIYPIASDPFLNEEDTQRRWEPSMFPEDNVSDQFLRLHMEPSPHQPILSYAIGDFVSTYSSPSKHGLYGSIATCFFIDTAINIYEYILTIRNLLRAGGVWINLGPVQWHRHVQLQPSTNELKDLILMAGFKIKHWEMSEELLAYRHEDDIRKGTRVEAYRPLKFVALLQPDCLNAGWESKNLLSSVEKLRLMTGRRSGIDWAVLARGFVATSPIGICSNPARIPPKLAQNSL